MPPKPDRRTEKSRKALLGAFVAILLEEGYAAVTVERVAARADVGRSTFYTHFTGKEDILRQAMARPSSVLAVIVGHDLAPEAIVPQLLHFHAQRRRNGIVFADPVRAIWAGCLADLIEPRLAAVARQARARPILPLAVIARQIAEAQLALIAGWLGGRAAAKPEAVAEALIATTRALTAALLRAAPTAPLFIAGEKLRIVQA
ncbi:MAG TPA: TetR/AcrR family transcriptional regulator [Rhizomicrobium sp.]|nr:TetR/AcrR family transcriptional regulator [Rhizomicrobium sp.]